MHHVKNRANISFVVVKSGRQRGGPVYSTFVLRTQSWARLLLVYRLFSFSGGTFLRGVQGNPNYFPILVQGDAVHGISPN